MNCILRIAVLLTFVIGLSSIYVCKALWACDDICSNGVGHSNQEIGDYAVHAELVENGGKGTSVKDHVCGLEVCDIKKAPCCIGQLTLQWTKLWRLAMTERYYRKSTKERVTTSARNSV